MMSVRWVDSFMKFISSSSGGDSTGGGVPRDKKRRGRRHREGTSGSGGRRGPLQYADSFIFVPSNEESAQRRSRANTDASGLYSLLKNRHSTVQDTPVDHLPVDQSPLPVDQSPVDRCSLLAHGPTPVYQRLDSVSGPSLTVQPVIRQTASCTDINDHKDGSSLLEEDQWNKGGVPVPYNPASIDDDDYAHVKDPDRLMKSLGRPLSPTDIMLADRLGEGQFGDVHKGILYPDTTEEVAVAVKTCKPDSAPEERVKFLQEAAIMKQFNHPHIVKLFGVVTQGLRTYIVMELAPLGQLRQYLLLNGESISQDILLNYIKQLCSAMVHLESKNYVHRDIAARNILLLSPDKIKLSDFGLSRWLEEADFYVASRGKLPIKWMAPESINFRRFTGSSDVWMFGVCCWEILMRGVKPFMSIKNDEVIGKLERGERLPLPPDCPPSLFNIMNHCWQYEPEERPSFTDIEQQLCVILEQEKHFNALAVSGRIRGYEVPDRPHVPIGRVPSGGAHRPPHDRPPHERPPHDRPPPVTERLGGTEGPVGTYRSDDGSTEGPPLPPRSVLNRPLPPEPTRKTRTNGSDSTVDPYLVTTLPGRGATPPPARGATPPIVTTPPLAQVVSPGVSERCFSPVPPPAIIRQQQKTRGSYYDNEEQQPGSDGYYSTVYSGNIEEDSINRNVRDPSPYEDPEEVGVASGGGGVASEEEEEEDDDSVLEELLACTTGVVQSIVELSTKLPAARPGDYVDLVKGVGVSLRQLLVKVDSSLDMIPEHTHSKVKMAHKVLSSDMTQLVKSMKELQENYQSFLLDHYQKQMLQSANIIAVNSKHLLEAFSQARRSRRHKR
ncbi:PREDICTED: focal adhesion kinase 1-like isoform X3 [Amphimedon queenslandica]|uniref:Protein kinase domain-containing protein n=1 Tax=Amphimedon queenslandica TaxID=400682 RepID=A0AAN0J604_AMPQE|nr:PREDICTED: focal adhesion kinase 1-like isoform X3 [Amphimedon queenslandica]|eukprot:XP_019852141.1 PREDICTED: focal adhesion kinase 1-like isoform X3 [Amphimedon queenslandica]